MSSTPATAGSFEALDQPPDVHGLRDEERQSQEGQRGVFKQYGEHRLPTALMAVMIVWFLVLR